MKGIWKIFPGRGDRVDRPNFGGWRPIVPALILTLCIAVQFASIQSYARKERVNPALNMAVADTHWAFVGLEKPAVPGDAVEGWGEAVDAFVERELIANGLAMSEEADRRTLIRRVTYDLTGLPPSMEAVEAFVANESPDAYVNLVESLLASPAYGERWARHWLDIARYADTAGVFRGGRYSFAHTYRDYVIRAFNEDKPYDRFLLEQLAADKLELEDKRDLAAMGFLTLGRSFFGRKDFIIDDQIDAITRGLQGLTVSCARCHDHKSDPIPMADYYSMHGIFASSKFPDELPIIADPVDPDSYQCYESERQRFQAKIDRIKDEVIDTFIVEERSLAGVYLNAVEEGSRIEDKEEFKVFAGSRKIDADILRLWVDYLDTESGRAHPALRKWFDEFREGDVETGVDYYNEGFKLAAENAEDADAAFVAFLNDADSPLNPDRGDVAVWIRRRINGKTGEWERQMKSLDWTSPGAPIRAHVMTDVEKPRNSKVYKRGDPKNLGDEVPRQYLQILNASGREPFSAGSGRLELARQIADAGNPLTARVFVNRVWGWHMGNPLVSTPSDFGVETPEPVHIDLLNWLAVTFIESGWSVKNLHRAILYSKTYRQSSDPTPEALEIDPANELWHSFPKTRLDFESMRDTVLAVSGNLDRTMGGVQVDITNPKENRRSVYAFIDRQDLPGMFRTFDHPSPDASSPMRLETEVPQQALFLMNSPFMIEGARQLIERVSNIEVHGERIQQLYRYAYQREAMSEEISDGLDFVGAMQLDAISGEDNAALSNWELYAQALLQSNEMMFLD